MKSSIQQIFRRHFKYLNIVIVYTFFLLIFTSTIHSIHVIMAIEIQFPVSTRGKGSQHENDSMLKSYKENAKMKNK